jgi:hypothetical protein
MDGDCEIQKLSSMKRVRRHPKFNRRSSLFPIWFPVIVKAQRSRSVEVPLASGGHDAIAALLHDTNTNVANAAAMRTSRIKPIVLMRNLVLNPDPITARHGCDGKGKSPLSE